MPCGYFWRRTVISCSFGNGVFICCILRISFRQALILIVRRFRFTAAESGAACQIAEQNLPCSLVFLADHAEPQQEAPEGVFFVVITSICASVVRCRRFRNHTLLLFLNEQPVGDVRSEINNNDGLIFYQNGLPKGIIREGMNGWLQYISYNFQPQNQPSYFNQNYHATSATSYNFNINNIPANVEGIEAVERMLSSVIPYIPQCSKEVNISINFDGSSSTNDNVIDTTAF